MSYCHNLRIPQHKDFLDSARREQSGMGWLHGFKLQLVISELPGCYLTPGNVDDRRPVPGMVKDLWGKLFGDNGYISRPLAMLLGAQGLRLVTKLRTSMKTGYCHSPTSCFRASGR